MGKPSIPDGVTVRHSILHAYYRVDDVPYDTVVQGISTAVLADMFKAGEPVYKVAGWYSIDRDEVEAALRWELHDRRWRVERVREAVKKGQATHG